MVRRKNNGKDDSVAHVFTEIVAAVVFFMVLFVIVQQLRYIEVFEKEKVKNIQGFLEKEILQTFEENDLKDRTPQISVDPNSPLIQKITMTNNTLRFDSGEADFQTPEDAKIVDLIGRILKENHQVIEALQVEGHTDTVNIDTPRYPSNWELSSARAATVVHRMTEVAKFPAEKISAVGFSQYHPVDESLLRFNRRIDFIIRYSFSKEFTYNPQATKIYGVMDSLHRAGADFEKANF